MIDIAAFITSVMVMVVIIFVTTVTESDVVTISDWLQLLNSELMCN